MSSDPWALEQAMLASCYVVGVGCAAVSALVQQQTCTGGNRRRNRRKTRNGGSSVDTTSTSFYSRTDGGSVGSFGGRSSLAGSLQSGGTRTSVGDYDAAAEGLEDDEDCYNHLPLCNDDVDCSLLNDPTHYKMYTHTCRLNPCYHAHLEMHCRYFRHSEEQCPQYFQKRPPNSRPNTTTTSTMPPSAAAPKHIRTTEEITVDSPMNATPSSRDALGGSHGEDGSSSVCTSSSVGLLSSSTKKSLPTPTEKQQHHLDRGKNCTGSGNCRVGGKEQRNHSTSSGSCVVSPSQSYISPNVPGAVQVAVECNGTNFYIWGNWELAKVHSLRRYLHQVTGITPLSQRIVVAHPKSEEELSQQIEIADDTASVSSFGVDQDCVLRVLDTQRPTSPPPSQSSSQPPASSSKAQGEGEVSAECGDAKDVVGRVEETQPEDPAAAAGATTSSSRRRRRKKK